MLTLESHLRGIWTEWLKQPINIDILCSGLVSEPSCQDEAAAEAPEPAGGNRGFC